MNLKSYRVEVNGIPCIVFEENSSKAKMKAVKGYWDAFGRRKGEWPKVMVQRLPFYDSIDYKNLKKPQCWSEEEILKKLNNQ